MSTIFAFGAVYAATAASNGQRFTTARIGEAVVAQVRKAFCMPGGILRGRTIMVVETADLIHKTRVGATKQRRNVLTSRDNAGRVARLPCVAEERKWFRECKRRCRHA